MTNQVIPAEAVDAAARKLCALAGYDWDKIAATPDVVADFRAQLTEQAKAILEAAAPHMQARASEKLMTSHANPTLERDIERVAARTGLLPSVVRACLTNYTTEAKAAAWKEGWSAGAGWPQIDTNPYGPTP